MKKLGVEAAIAAFLLLAGIVEGRSQTWNTQMINPGSVQSPRSICYDDGGNPIVFYLSSNTLYSSKWNGATWTTRDCSSLNYLHGATRADTLIHVVGAWSGSSDTYHRIIRLDGSLKSTFTLDASTYITDGDVTTSPTNEVLWCYSWGPGIMFRRYDPATGQWSVRDTVDEGPSLSSPCITTSADGRIWIAYQDGLGLNLKMARSRGDIWDVWTIDTEGNVGSNPQIVVDAGNVAHMTYYDATNRRLKYASFAP